MKKLIIKKASNRTNPVLYMLDTEKHVEKELAEFKNESAAEEFMDAINNQNMGIVWRKKIWT